MKERWKSYGAVVRLDIGPHLMGRMVANCQVPDLSMGDCEANAMLIAAAPELAGVLGYIDSAAPILDGSEDDGEYCVITITVKGLRDLRAALAKAGL